MAMLRERYLAYLLEIIQLYIRTVRKKCKLKDKPIKHFFESCAFGSLRIKVNLYILQILRVKLLKWALN